MTTNTEAKYQIQIQFSIAKLIAFASRIGIDTDQQVSNIFNRVQEHLQAIAPLLLAMSQTGSRWRAKRDPKKVGTILSLGDEEPQRLIAFRFDDDEVATVYDPIYFLDYLEPVPRPVVIEQKGEGNFFNKVTEDYNTGREVWTEISHDDYIYAEDAVPPFDHDGNDFLMGECQGSTENDSVFVGFVRIGFSNEEQHWDRCFARQIERGKFKPAAVALRRYTLPARQVISARHIQHSRRRSMANNFMLTALAFKNVTAEESEWLTRQWKRLESGYDPDETKAPDDYEIAEDVEYWDCNLQVNDDGGEGIAHIYDHDNFNAAWLAAFLADFLKRFQPDGTLTFSWAETCSKPRPDEFGAGSDCCARASMS